jgi:hypothetical protein
VLEILDPHLRPVMVDAADNVLQELDAVAVILAFP